MSTTSLVDSVQPSVLDSECDKELGLQLAAIEEVRYILYEQNIVCPGVVVVGQQSSGKSSVLEQLTGIAFPRAANTCTRVPTIVRLVRSKTVEIEVSIDATFPAASTDTAEDPKAIGDLLSAAQATLMGDGGGVKDEPIHVRYGRPEGPVMTLIDLPGITHVSDSKLKDQDIHQETAAMVKKYIEQDNQIVLVVIPAHDDFGNTEALEMVKKIDGAEARAIGVVTKCDLLPRNPDHKDILLKLRAERPGDVPLDHGYIAVRNRGHTEDKLTDREVRDKEVSLFRSHPVLSDLKEHERGYPTLTKKIVSLQGTMVAKWFPVIKKVLREKIKEHDEALNALGSAPDSISACRAILTRLLRKIDKRLDALIRARDTHVPKINVAARSREAAVKMSTTIAKNLPIWLSEKYGNEVTARVAETQGYCMSNFISDPIFRSEINKHFFNNNNVHDAVQTLNQTIHTLMQNTFAELLKTESESKTWDKLSEVVVETWTSHLEQSLKTLREHNQLTLEAECAQMFTLNHYYEETVSKIKRQAKELVETPECRDNGKLPTISCFNTEVSDDTSERKNIMQRAQNLEQELKVESGFIARYSEQGKTDAKELSVLKLQVSLHCYSKVMTKRLNDNVALMARLLLINKPHEQLYVMMLALKDNTLKQALAEDASTVKKRKRHERAKAHLVKAQNTLRRFY